MSSRDTAAQSPVHRRIMETFSAGNYPATILPSTAGISPGRREHSGGEEVSVAPRIILPRRRGETARNQEESFDESQPYGRNPGITTYDKGQSQGEWKRNIGTMKGRQF